MSRTCAGVGAFLIWTLSASATGHPAAHLSPQETNLSIVLDKATAYVTAYVQALSSVVSEERYEQTVTRLVSRGAIRPSKETVRRVLVSDYLLVQLPGSSEWMPFRDVYSTDGAPVRDRDDRLFKLFVQPSATSVAHAVQIRDESSRYNIGNVTRDINVPTFALQFLGADQRPGFAFEQGGRTRLDGVDVMQIDFRETASPTIIRDREGEDVPAKGRLWVRPDTGAVLRSLLETRPAGLRTRIQVDFRYDSRLEMLVPGEMNERHELDDQVVQGRSSYSNFRRFRVDATFDIK